MKKAIFILWFLLGTCCSNAQNFYPVGDGLSYAGVRSLAADTTNGILYASGNFINTGSGLVVNGVARWDGGLWDSISSGIPPGAVGYAVSVHDNLVYFGGSFFTFCGEPDTGLAVFDGVNIIPFANVVSPSNIGNCRGLMVHGQDIYVLGYRGFLNGTQFNQVAKWDGTSWTNYPMLDSLEGWPVVTAAIYNNELYVGGNFEGYGSGYMKDIAKFNGTSWVPVGNGLSGYLTAVNAMIVYNGKLVIGGGFKTVNGNPGNCIAAWDGNSWSQYGSGIDGAYISSMEVVGNDLYVGGFFTSAGGSPAMNLAKWDGNQWHSLGATFHPNAVVSCLEYMNNELYIGGGFDSINGITMNHIARYSIPTGIAEHEILQDIQIYPTISNGSITVEANQVRIKSVEIRDAAGRILRNENTTGNRFIVDTSGISSGIYFVTIHSTVGIITRKIIVL